MADAGNTGIKRIIRAAGFSYKGFVACLGNNALERAVMIGVWLIVPTVEMLNSGIEAVVDRISDEQHPLAGRAKDLGSAAVFLSFTNAVVVWAILLSG
jgi:diacylglycerol kinase (ATP)